MLSSVSLLLPYALLNIPTTPTVSSEKSTLRFHPNPPINMLAVQSSNNSRESSPVMTTNWSHKPQNQRDPSSYRSDERDAATSNALLREKLTSPRPSPDVFQNGHMNNNRKQSHYDSKQAAFSIDSDDLLTPQRDALSSAASTSSSPQDSVPDPSGVSDTSSSPPNQSRYRYQEYPQRQTVASPTFSNDSHRSSHRASPNPHKQSFPDEFGRASFTGDQPTVRPGDLHAQQNQGLSPLSPFTEPFSPPSGRNGHASHPESMFGGHQATDLTEKRSASSLNSVNSQTTASSMDAFSTSFTDFRPSSASSSIIQTVGSIQQAKMHPALAQNGDGSASGAFGYNQFSAAPGAIPLPQSNNISDRLAPSSRSSQDSSAATSTAHLPSTTGAPEEISTIFVIGFPDDMHEREFQNMFIFSPGFEAAILKTPHGTSGGSNASNSSRDGAYSATPKMPPTSAVPYGVTTDQFGVPLMPGPGMFDSHMEDASAGPTLSHALSQRDGPRDLNHRKQIIGFAKFRSRQEAMDAKDVLSGRRVDAEKDCVLKAEMAKKNLHTRRGLANEAPAGATSSVGVGNTAGNSSLPSSVLALGQQNLAIAASLSPALLANIAQRSPSVQTAAAAAHAAANAPLSADAAHGSALRDADQLSPNRDRTLSAVPQQRSAFDAFHSVPPTQLSPPYASRQGELAGGPTESRFNFGAAGSREASSPPASGPARQNPAVQPPYSRFGDAGFGKSLLQQLDGGEDQFPAISQTNDSFTRHAFFNGRSEELAGPSQLGPGPISPPPGSHSSFGSSPPASNGNFGSRFQGLSLNTGLSSTTRATSPPTSGMLSPRAGNPADMNPPINTLYVGGLPAVLPSLTGPMSASHLEDSLRSVFSRSPGFKRLCFRQKSK